MNGTWTFDDAKDQCYVTCHQRKRGVKADARRAQEKAIDTIRDVLRGASGKVPQLDLLRIWDSGVSQGMTDRSLVSSDASVNYHSHRQRSSHQ